MFRRERPALWASILLFVCLVSAVGIHAVQAEDGGEGPLGTNPNKVFAPLIQKPPVYLTGKITYRGAAAVNQPVELRFYNGSSYSTAASATTDTNGNYKLIPPNLSSGQSMYVRWINTASNDAWLYVWYCDSISSTPTSDVTCSFDIQDIDLTLSTQYVYLPYTFKWTRRTTTSDSYEYNLADYTDLDPWASSVLLGYVSSFTMGALPSTFSTGTTYVWWVNAYGPNGYGEPYYVVQVIFSNRGAAAAGPQGETELVPHSAPPDPLVR